MTSDPSLHLATFNLQNFGPATSTERLQRLALAIAGPLDGPDLLAVQEVCAPDVAGGHAPADDSFMQLIDAIQQVGGPHYQYCEVPPLTSRDGGRIGANIRPGLLFNSQCLRLAPAPTGWATTAVGVRRRAGHVSLTCNPGRIEPLHPAFEGSREQRWQPSRKALVAQLIWRDAPLFVINCHLKSMRTENKSAENAAKRQRHAQAERIRRFAETLLACDAEARIIILGDMNDHVGSRTLDVLCGQHFVNVHQQLPRALRYTHRQHGRPQTLDHVLISPSLWATARVPHLNSDADPALRCSDHDPVLVEVQLRPRHATDRAGPESDAIIATTVGT